MCWDVCDAIEQNDYKGCKAKAFASSVPNANEEAYILKEQPLLDVIWFVEYLVEYYLFGNYFTGVTDHCLPLSIMRSHCQNKSIDIILTRWNDGLLFFLFDFYLDLFLAHFLN